MIQKHFTTKRRKIKWGRLLLLISIPCVVVFWISTLHKTKAVSVIDVIANENTSFDLKEEEDTRWLAEIEAEEEEAQYESIGKFKITYYCPGSCCNGSNAGLDCKGNPLRPGTIATNDLPYGTVVYIKWGDVWCEYTVRDRMAKKARKMPHIDIFVDAPHKDVQAMGVDYKEVFIKKK